MTTAQRNFFPANFNYTVNLIGTTKNGVGVEIDVHLGDAGIGRAVLSLIEVYQGRLMQTFGWQAVTPMVCSVMRAHGASAEHLGLETTVYIGQPPITASDSVGAVAHQIAALYVCEACEIFSRFINKGWDDDLWSHTEALSRFIGNAFVPNGLAAVGVQSVAGWLNAPNRPDWISKSANLTTNAADYQIATGCGVAFLHLLHDVLGIPIEKIVQAPGGNMEAKYQFLTNQKGGYKALRQAIDRKFPVGQPVSNILPMDSPFLFH